MKKIFIQYIKKSKNIIFVSFGSLFFFILFRFLVFYKELTQFYSLSGISLFRKFSVFYEYIFLYFSSLEHFEQITTVILAILSALNFLFFIIFAKKQGKYLQGKSFFTAVSGIFLGFFGVGCISCGAFVLAPLITFLGLGAYMNFFTDNANYFSIIGIIFIIISIIYLLKQIAKPLVCK